jgi:hypothetical protein
MLKGASEEPAGGRQISLLGHEHVDDLADHVRSPRMDMNPSR